ncbi:MAG: hypothetical protein RML15_07105 [Bacteroidota bacterium]|nr:hypothetical protein [Candidatus Kapabacteria bacterium]MDW8272161.1 hypothetical protein [Bacteroidota bacterium]
MRLFFAIAPLLFLMALAGHAQQGSGDQLGEITFEDLQDKQSSSAYFGIGAGYVGGFWYYPATDINANLAMPYSMHGDYSAPLFTSGVSGFLTLSLVGNLRVGFEALSGSSSHTESQSGGQHRATLSLSSAALQLDYALPLLRGFIVAPGVFLGRGLLSFEHTTGPASTQWPNANGNLGQAVTSTLAAPFWLIRPTVSLEYALSGYATVRAWGSYNVTLMGTWQENNITTVNNVPSAINARGFAAGFGLFIGLFRSE